MRTQQRKHELIVDTGLPVSSILLLIGAIVTVVLASIHALKSGILSTKLLWIAAFAISMLAFAWIGGEFSVFSFSKTERCFRWCHRRLFVKRTGQVPLKEVIGAQRDTHRDSEGSKTYRLVINTSNRTIRLTDSFRGNGKEILQIVDLINQFIATETNPN